MHVIRKKRKVDETKPTKITQEELTRMQYLFYHKQVRNNLSSLLDLNENVRINHVYFVISLQSCNAFQFRLTI